MRISLSIILFFDLVFLSFKTRLSLITKSELTVFADTKDSTISREMFLNLEDRVVLEDILLAFLVDLPFLLVTRELQ